MKEISAALRNMQIQLNSVKKDRQGYGYKYADLAGCLDVLREPLFNNNLCVSQMLKIIDGKQVLITQLMHDSGEFLTSEYILEPIELKGQNAIQAMGTAITYARRYSLAAIVGLSQEDSDGVIEKDSGYDESKALARLCQSNGIAVKDFVKFFEITREDDKKIKYAIKNFEALSKQFKNKKQEGE